MPFLRGDGMAFADLLFELRTARGLSQEELAERAAVSLRAIGDLERGTTRRPQQQTVKALAAGLGIAGSERVAFERAARGVPRPAPRRGTPQVRLAAPTSSIVGRDSEVAAVAKLVRGAGVRLVTITGPGGVGKTRLAAEVAWRLGSRFERVDGVDLSATGTPEDVPAALAAALGCFTGAGDPVQAVSVLVGDHPWLLVLDSFEHLLDGALVLTDLLGRCPQLRLLVTSRAPLRLRGEYRWPLSPLPVPAEDEHDLATIAAVPAVALLVERVRAVRPGFALTATGASALSRLCRRLDGLPLAIELAAAQLRTLDPAELVAALDGQLATLRAEAVDVPDRQQTLRSTVAWSVERLGDEPRLVLNVLSVFVGGATLPMLREVVERAALPVAALDAAVSLLAATSLATVQDREGSARISMLDTIRDVAGVLLEESGRAVPVRRAHANTVLELLRGKASGTGDRLDAELGNVRAGLCWTIAHEPALADSTAVEGFVAYCVARSAFRELYRVLAALAEVVPDAAARAQALRGAGMGANESGDHRTAIVLAHRAGELFEKLDNTAGRCAALTLEGNAYKALSDLSAAKAAYHACLEQARAAGFTRGVTVSLNNLGTLAHNEAEYGLARDYYRQSLEVKYQLGDERGIAVTLMNLAAIANDLGEYEVARAELTRARELTEEPYSVAFGLVLLAEAQCGLGDPEAAYASATEGLRISREVQHEPTTALALTRLGDIAVATGDGRGADARYREALAHSGAVPEVARTLERLAGVQAGVAPGEAAELLTRADQMRRAHGTPVPPVDRAGIARTREILAGR